MNKVPADKHSAEQAIYERVHQEMVDSFDEELEMELEDEPHESGERVSATNVCSWCGKLEGEVKKLLGRSGTALCNECVALACDIMEAELGDGWR